MNTKKNDFGKSVPPSTFSSITNKSDDSKCFDPSPLSNKLLNQLWQIAERQGNWALQCKIEEEIFERLEERIEKNIKRVKGRG